MYVLGKKFSRLGPARQNRLDSSRTRTTLREETPYLEKAMRLKFLENLAAKDGTSAWTWDSPRSTRCLPSSPRRITEYRKMINLKPIAQASNQGDQSVERARFDEVGSRAQIERPLHVFGSRRSGCLGRGWMPRPRVRPSVRLLSGQWPSRCPFPGTSPRASG